MPRLEIVTGAAPDALASLPQPDAVFIGGGCDAIVIEKSWNALRPGGRLVVNAITLETEKEVLAAQAKFGGSLTRLSVERLDAVGSKQAFRPAMTVTQWSVGKP